MSPNDDEPTDSGASNFLDPLGPRFGRRTFLKGTGIGIMGTLLSGTAAGDDSARKTRASFYTDEKRQAARENIETYSWAASARNRAVNKAETIIEEYTLDELWHYVGSQHIPRASYLANGDAGYYPWSSEWEVKSPVSGVAYAAQPGQQWKITNGEYTLPTNDFEAYRQSGRDETGQFDPERADDSLLVNEEHPEMGPQWGVDDGLGWVDEAGDLGSPGQQWVPVAWAHHWYGVYGVRSLIDSLAQAYLFTEDERYARAAAVLLDRLADVYPEMSLQETVYFDEGGYTEWNGFPNKSHGGTGKGKQVGSIWESYWVKAVMKAYDAIFPALDADVTLSTFLQAKATEFPGLSTKETMVDTRTNIEEGFIKQMLPGVKQAQIRGNFGSHQQTLALSAVIQDDSDGYTDETLEFLSRAGELIEEDDGTPYGHWYLTGGGILARLLSDFDRDGFPNEESVHYNSLVVSGVQSTADTLNGYTGAPNLDLYQTPIFKRTFETQSRLTFLNQYVPRLGDTSGAGQPGFEDMIDPDDLVRAYQANNNEELIKWTYLRNGNSTSGLRGTIFETNPEVVSERIETALEASGPLELDSTQLAGFGFTALRSGSVTQGTGRGVWTYYGRNAFGPDAGYGTSHTHRDALNIGLFGHGLNLSPDLGYPEDTGNWPKRWNWTSNTISHNTVVVNERQQDRQWIGIPEWFDHTDRVQLSAIEADEAYDEAKRYHRTTAQITVDEENSYVTDFFHIYGGEDHHFSFHGPAVPADQFEYELRDEVSELTIRAGAGGIGVSPDAATAGEWSTRIFDPSSNTHEWRGLTLPTESSDVDVQLDINSAVTGEQDYWHHVQAVYLGQDTDGRHVCAGVGNQGAEQDPRIGLYYPESNTWDSSDTMDDWEKRTWYSLSVSTRGSTVDITLQTTDGTVHASGTYTLPSETDQRVGIFGGVGEGQTGELYFDAFILNGTPREFLRTDLVEQSAVSTRYLNLTEQDSGTYAGPDIPKPDYGEDTQYNNDVGNGFNYLYDVEREADPNWRFSVEWDSRDHWGVRTATDEDVKLRLTMLTKCDDVAIANGNPPQRWNNPETLKYLIAHRNPEGHGSLFRSVIESYEGERFIEHATGIPVDSADHTARAVRVQLKNGRTDYIASATVRPGDDVSEHTVDDVFTFDGAFAVYSTDAEGTHEHAYLLDGTTLEVDGERLIEQRPRIEGVVEDFTRDLSLDNELQVRITNGPVDTQLMETTVGSWVYADAVDDRNGAYEIVGVDNVTSTSATLKLGDQTTVKEYRDPSDLNAGYEYILEENGEFVIPLSTEFE
ncbi:Heparinase II/III-like protein [Halogranum rubrum]|uniref:Heparinase II/III-like protein n=1 Tax=Halogranum rubrum TaxID=553466 RepID=A0A1I4BAT7_9EURY|nr:heparinase II/III family protein [Halogranum rubrum]SFK65247.1 Heparinase II/III-like protein [Halogranum rubrum]